MSRADRIKEAVKASFAPLHMTLLDESDRHRGRAGQESHFNLVVVSAAFAGHNAVARQRLVYRALAAEMGTGLHALTLKTLTPDEWERAGGAVVNPSPNCHTQTKAAAARESAFPEGTEPL